MKNLIKYVAAGAAVYALYYFFIKKNKTENSTPVVDNTNMGVPEATQVGSNATQTRQGIIVQDTTTRRCIDENGKTIYVKGPCPTHKYVIAASYGSR